MKQKRKQTYKNWFNWKCGWWKPGKWLPGEVGKKIWNTQLLYASPLGKKEEGKERKKILE